MSSLALARVGNPFSRGITPRVCVIGDGDCHAIPKDYDEHAIDSYSNVIGDYDYSAVNGTDGEYD